jgi:hypothetical protein
LNGQALEIVDSVLGVYPGQQTPADVYPITNLEKPGHVSLHTYPIGIVDHVLGLKGENGLYSLVDVVKVSQSADALYYDNFILNNGVVTQDLPGRWVAFPSTDGWDVKWYDGK